MAFGDRADPAPPLAPKCTADTEAPIRVLLVDHQTAFRESLAFVLDHQAGIAVVGQVGSLADARLQLSEAEIVVLDLELPDGDGATLIHELHAVNPEGHALVLSASAHRFNLAHAVEAGASGLLHTSVPVARIVEAVRRLCAGELLLSPQELGALTREVRQQRAREVTTRRALGRLTPREREVIGCLGQGLGDKEIALRLGVSKETVHSHMVNLLGKLGVESRLQALILAVRHGVVSLD